MPQYRRSRIGASHMRLRRTAAAVGSSSLQAYLSRLGEATNSEQRYDSMGGVIVDELSASGELHRWGRSLRRGCPRLVVCCVPVTPRHWSGASASPRPAVVCAPLMKRRLPHASLVMRASRVSSADYCFRDRALDGSRRVFCAALSPSVSVP